MPKKHATEVQPGDWIKRGNDHQQVRTVTKRLTSGGQVKVEVITKTSDVPVGTVDDLFEVMPSPPPEVHGYWDEDGEQWVVQIDTPGATDKVLMTVFLNDADLFSGVPAVGDQRTGVTS